MATPTYILHNPQTGYVLLEATGNKLKFNDRHKLLFDTYGYRIPRNCRTGEFENKHAVRRKGKDKDLFIQAIFDFFIPEKKQRGFEYVPKPRPPIATK